MSVVAAGAVGVATAEGAATSFHERGYLQPSPMFSRNECRQILRALRRETAAPYWEKGWAAVSPAFYALATNDRILELVTELLGDDVLLWGASIQTRPPRAVHPWHTDIESSDPRSEIVSVWVGLAQTNAGSSLKVVPFSHRFGAPLQQVMQEQGVGRGDVTDDDLRRWAQLRDPRSDVVSLDSRDGDAVVFDGRLWHGSENLNRFGTRHAALLQYSTPRRRIRIPNLQRLTWPFEVHEVPQPPCLAVSGRVPTDPNLIVPGPVAADPSTLALRSRVHNLELPLEQDPSVGWKPHPLFRGATADLNVIGCHASVLDPQRQPHPPHRHPDEEVLIILDGEADLLLQDSSNPAATRRHRVRRGAVAYYPAQFAHTIQNLSDDPVTYVMFKWIGDSRQRDAMLPAQLVDAQEQAVDLAARATQAFETAPIWDGKTEYLRHFHAHVTALQPGAGYEPHGDAYDVAIIVLEGTVETLGQRLSRHGVAFYVAGEPHGMRNVGDGPALYLVLEFHAGRAAIPAQPHAIARAAARARRAPRRLKRALARLT